MSYEVLYIKKGGVTLYIPLWLLDYPHDSSHYIVTIHIPLMTLVISLTIYLQIIIQFPHIPMWDEIGLIRPNKTNIITRGLAERLNRQHPLDGLRWWTDTKLGTTLLCPHTIWWCLSQNRFFPPWISGIWFWNLCPSHLEACATLSWVWLDHRCTSACFPCSDTSHRWWPLALNSLCTSRPPPGLGSSSWIEWGFWLKGFCVSLLWHPDSWTIVHRKPQF